MMLLCVQRAREAFNGRGSPQPFFIHPPVAEARRGSRGTLRAVIRAGADTGHKSLSMGDVNRAGKRTGGNNKTPIKSADYRGRFHCQLAGRTGGPQARGIALSRSTVHAESRGIEER